MNVPYTKQNAMDDSYENRKGAQFDQPGVTGLRSDDAGPNSYGGTFSAPGAGDGTTGFGDSRTGQGTTGFDQTSGGGDEAGQGGAFSSDPNDNVTGFSRNSQGPGSHGAAFEAPGTGTQKTGFSNIESGHSGFEGGSDDTRTVDVGGKIKDKFSQLKDNLSSSGGGGSDDSS